MPNYYNPTIRDLVASFVGISKDGENHRYSGEPKISDMTQSHIQGAGPWKNYLVLAHNDNTDEHGYIMVVNRDSQKLKYKFRTPNYNHPGGCQVIGDFMIVAIENGDYSKSRLRFYDLSAMSDSTHPTLLETPNIYNGHGAGSAGITNYQDSVLQYYVIASVDDDKLTTYRSNGGVPLGDPTLTFTKGADRQDLADSYSSVGLVTDERQDLWLLGFRSKGTPNESMPTSYADYVDLYQIDRATLLAGPRLKTRHMYTHGDPRGVGGVHFRWAGALQVRSNTELEFYAMQRNFVGGETHSNTFKE